MPLPQMLNGRERAYGQNYEPTGVDRLGVWLSARQIRKHAGPVAGKSLGDFGCGYHAEFVRKVLQDLERAVLVDSALAEDLKGNSKVTAIEGDLPDSLAQIAFAVHHSRLLLGDLKRRYYKRDWSQPYEQQS